MSKTFLVEITECNGDHVSLHNVLADGDDGYAVGRRVLANWYTNYDGSYVEDPEDEGTFVLDGGSITVSCSDFKDIPDDEVIILKKYISYYPPVVKNNYNE